MVVCVGCGWVSRQGGKGGRMGGGGGTVPEMKSADSGHRRVLFIT